MTRVGHLPSQLGEARLDLLLRGSSIIAGQSRRTGAEHRSAHAAARCGPAISSSSSRVAERGLDRVGLEREPLSARPPRRPVHRQLAIHDPAPILESTLRISACAHTAFTNTPCWRRSPQPGLPFSGDWATGRETQSRAFLRAPGIEPLYSGVAMRNRVRSGSAAPKRLDAVGLECSSSSL